MARTLKDIAIELLDMYYARESEDIYYLRKQGFADERDEEDLEEFFHKTLAEIEQLAKE